MVIAAIERIHTLQMAKMCGSCGTLYSIHAIDSAKHPANGDRVLGVEYENSQILG